MASFSNDMVEFTVVEMKVPNIVTISMYRPPGTSDTVFRNALDNLDSVLEKHEAERRTIVLYGDMNFPDIKWTEDSEPMNVPDDLKKTSQTNGA